MLITYCVQSASAGGGSNSASSGSHYCFRAQPKDFDISVMHFLPSLSLYSPSLSPLYNQHSPCAMGSYRGWVRQRLPREPHLLPRPAQAPPQQHRPARIPAAAGRTPPLSPLQSQWLSGQSSLCWRAAASSSSAAYDPLPLSLCL